MGDLYDFIEESNRIEGIVRPITETEIRAHEDFLGLPEVRVPEVEHCVAAVALRPLRDRIGMDVRGGDHRPPAGGPQIRAGLSDLLTAAKNEGPITYSPWAAHVAYERLHPFMDGK